MTCHNTDNRSIRNARPCRYAHVPHWGSCCHKPSNRSSGILKQQPRIQPLHKQQHIRLHIYIVIITFAMYFIAFCSFRFVVKIVSKVSCFENYTELLVRDNFSLSRIFAIPARRGSQVPTKYFLPS